MIRRAEKLTTNIGSYLSDFAIKTCTEAASVHASVHHYDSDDDDDDDDDNEGHPEAQCGGEARRHHLRSPPQAPAAVPHTLGLLAGIRGGQVEVVGDVIRSFWCLESKVIDAFYKETALYCMKNTYDD